MKIVIIKNGYKKEKVYNTQALNSNVKKTDIMKIIKGICFTKNKEKKEYNKDLSILLVVALILIVVGVVVVVVLAV